MIKAPAADRIPTKRSKRSARLPYGRHWVNGLLAGLALAGLFGRVLVPPGFMPGGEGGGWIELCPAGLNAQFLRLDVSQETTSLAQHQEPASSAHDHGAQPDESENSAHHEHSDESEFPAEHGSTPVCPIGQTFSSSALTESVCLDVQQLVVSLDERRVDLAAAQIVASTVQARGPPAVRLA